MNSRNPDRPDRAVLRRTGLRLRRGGRAHNVCDRFGEPCYDEVEMTVGLRSVCACCCLAVMAAGCAERPPAAPQDAREKTQQSRSAEMPPDPRVLLTGNLLRGIDTALLLYATDQGGVFPAGRGPQVLERLTRKTKDEFGIESGPWLDDHTDAWGRPFNYEWPTAKTPRAKKPAVWSSGPNGKNEDGRGDDIANWNGAKGEPGPTTGPR